MRALVGSLVRNADHRSVALGFVDQGFSSATNFGLSVLAGRLLGPAGLGEVFLGFSIYLVALELQRRVLTEPVLASAGGHDFGGPRDTARRSLTMAIVLGLAASCIALVAGILLPGFAGRGVLLIAPWLLPTLFQDVVRSVLFRDGRPTAATVNDLVWLVVMALAIVPAWRLGTAEATIACWGVGALAGAVVGLLQVGVRPASTSDAFAWWRRAALPFGKWNAGAAIIYQIGSNAIVFVLAAILGAASLGGLRAAQTVFAPLTLVVPAVSLPGLPLVARALRDGRSSALRVSGRLSGVAFAATLTYAVMIALGGWRMLPLLFGEPFSQFRGLIWPIAVAQLLTSAGVGPLLLMKAELRGRVLLVNRAIASAATLILVTSLASYHGLLGAAWGTAGGAFVSLALLTWATTGKHTLPRLDARRSEVGGTEDRPYGTDDPS